MKNQGIRQQVSAGVAAGQSKQALYQALLPQADNPGQLAYWLAATASPARRQQHRQACYALMGVMAGQALLLLAAGYAQTGWQAVFSALVPLAFAAGFSRWVAAAFNIYILYALIQLPQLLSQLAQGGWAVAQLLMWLLTLLLTWQLRSRVFPDFTPLCVPRRDSQGQFVFRD